MKVDNDKIIFEYGDKELFEKFCKENLNRNVRVINDKNDLWHKSYIKIFEKQSDYIPFDEFVEKFDEMNGWLSHDIMCNGELNCLDEKKMTINDVMKHMYISSVHFGSSFLNQPNPQLLKPEVEKTLLLHKQPYDVSELLTGELVCPEQGGYIYKQSFELNPYNLPDIPEDKWEDVEKRLRKYLVENKYTNDGVDVETNNFKVEDKKNKKMKM